MYNKNLEYDPDPTWQTIQTMVLGLCYQIVKSGFTPDVIIGIQRGGLIPATILSHALNVPLIIADYSSTEGRGDDKSSTNQIPSIPPTLWGHILIVDDICDSGHTLKELHNWFANHYTFSNLKTLALFTKHGSVYTPDYFSYDLPEDAPFINFPWEIKYNISE